METLSNLRWQEVGCQTGCMFETMEDSAGVRRYVERGKQIKDTKKQNAVGLTYVVQALLRAIGIRLGVTKRGHIKQHHFHTY